MTARRTGLVFSFLVLALPAVCADSLEDVLTRMDQLAKNFKSFSAKIARTDYDKLFDEYTKTEGVVRMRQTKDGLTGVIENVDGQVEYFEGRTAQIYHPKANMVDIYDLGKQANMVQQVILLGFGTRRADLEKNYSIKLGGPDSVGSVRTTRIELTPKAKAQRDVVARIELWIPEGEGYPIQEKITVPSNNYNLVTYSDMKLPAPPGSNFKLDLPKDVHKNYPQK